MNKYSGLKKDEIILILEMTLGIITVFSGLIISEVSQKVGFLLIVFSIIVMILLIKYDEIKFNNNKNLNFEKTMEEIENELNNIKDYKDYLFFAKQTMEKNIITEDQQILAQSIIFENVIKHYKIPEFELKILK